VFRSRRVLVLTAHPDDEFGCAGLVARLVEDGAEVHLACFSDCEQSVPAGFSPDVLRGELREATAILGIPAANVRMFDFPVRHFPTHRQEILEILVALRAELEPDLVLLPSSADIHQDHGTVSAEGIRAFKHATLLGYELPMNNITFVHACYVELEPRHIELKIRHSSAYVSQQHRPYMRPEFLRSLVAVRGLQMNAPAAEAYEVIRMMVPR
jgi:LmbE family N-acetylglucosaminyl deacetylase